MTYLKWKDIRYYDEVIIDVMETELGNEYYLVRGCEHAWDDEYEDIIEIFEDKENTLNILIEEIESYNVKCHVCKDGYLDCYGFFV